MVNHTLSSLKHELGNIDYKIVLIFRKDKAVIPDDDTVIKDEDEVFFISSSDCTHKLLQAIRKKEAPSKSIMITGCGNIGLRLSLSLENKYKVKVIELNAERAHQASEVLKNTIVLNGDAADEEILLEENIEHTDFY